MIAKSNAYMNLKGWNQVTFDQVQIMLSVAEHHSFSTAGKKCFCSTSSVTRSIQALEKELNVTLFERNGKTKVELTEEGEQLLPYFINLAQDCHQLYREVGRLNQSEEWLHIIRTTAGPRLLAEILIKIHDISPNISILERYSTDHEAVESLLGGRADVCISSVLGSSELEHIYGPHMHDPRIVSYPINIEICCLLMNVKNPLAAKEKITLKDLSQYPETEFVFPSFEGNHDIQNIPAIRERLKELNLKIELKNLKLNIVNVKDLMNLYISKHKMAVTLLQKTTVDDDQCVIRTLDDEKLVFINYIYYLNSNRSQSLKNFIDCVKSYSGELA